MSNRIGNYVHYHKRNYMRYGIGMKKDNIKKASSSDFVGYREEIKNMIISQISDEQLHNLSKNYTYFFYGNPLDMNKINETREKALSMFLNEFNKKMYNRYSQIVRGFTSVESLENLIAYNENISKNLSNNKGYVEGKTFEKIYKMIERLAIQGVSNRHINYKEIKKNSEKINQLLKEFQQLDKQWTASRNKMKFNYSTKKNGDLGAQLKNLLNRTYEIIKLDTIPGSTNLIGILGEESAMMLAKVTGSMILDNVDDISELVYKKMVQGVKSNLKVIHTGKKESSVAGNSNKYTKSLRSMNGEYLLSAKKETQNKADFEMILPNEKKIGISVKNYSFANRNDIGLVDNTSIVRLASNLNTEFVNHWLNLITQSSEKNYSSSNYMALKNEADKTMKLGILALAASGKIAGKRNSAEIIAINNRTIRQWNFISIPNLIKKIDAVSFAKFVGYPEQPVIQNWVGKKHKRNYPEAMTRIHNVLNVLHSKKLKVSLNVTAKQGMKWIL